MSVAIVTGSAGLIGSETVTHFAELGFDVVGVDNDMRRSFFGDYASTVRRQSLLKRRLPSYEHHSIDIRDAVGIDRIFQRYGRDISLVVHTAAQPSHDWSAANPVVDFTINANGTQVLLEATRRYAADAVFIFTSTNKVYGDRPNRLPIYELETRWEISQDHPYRDGIPEDMPIDQSLHSPFGVSKLAADLMVQEYGRYFGMQTVCFRGGCLTGPYHAGTRLHGFLSYLMKCVLDGTEYVVFGHKGKQVRDNIHSADLVRAFEAFYRRPQVGAVYNIGGGRFSNCSVLEAISLAQEVSGTTANWRYEGESRKGDHIWWISDTGQFERDYPGWTRVFGVREILQDMAALHGT